MLVELQEAAQARNGRGQAPHSRDSFVSFAGRSRKWLESPAEEGGMSAKILPDCDSEVRKGPSRLEATARKDLRDTLRTFLKKKKGPKKKVVPGWSAPSELFIMALDPLYFAVRDSTPHGLGFRQNGVHKTDSGEGRAAEDSVAGEVRGWRQWSSAILGTFVKRSDTGQGKSEDWCKGAAIDPHVLHMVESLFQCCSAPQPSRDAFDWNDAFHGCSTGRRREGAVVSQRAVTVRLQKEGIQHITDFEDMSNAFSCASAKCRVEVL